MNALSAVDSISATISTAEISALANTLPRDERKSILMAMPETEMHIHLAEMYRRMEPSLIVEVTHGPNELGKDIVIVSRNRVLSDAIAVVVKVGSIKAKTLGDVDKLTARVNKVFDANGKKTIEEILSQARQATKHPALIRTHFDEIQISKVFVVLVGDLSAQARTRIKGELGANVEIFDVEWLIDRFTEYYPEAFYEGRVLDVLHKKIAELEAYPRLSMNGMLLSQYYVEPVVSDLEVPVSLDAESFSLILLKEKHPFSYLKTIASSSKNVIVIGEPGSGKSGALVEICIEQFRAAHAKALKSDGAQGKVELPIFITSKNLFAAQSSRALVEEFFGDVEFSRRVKVTSLVVDALDELASPERKDLIDKAVKYSKELKAGLIITSRFVDAVNTPMKGFGRYELMPFEFSQAVRFFEKVVKNDEKLSALKKGLKMLKGHIPMSPISLMFLVQIVEDKGEVPASRTELYERFVDHALGRYDKEKGIEVLFDYLVKKKFLGELAYSQFLQVDRLSMPRAEFEDYTNAYGRNYGLSDEQLLSFVREIERAGILDIREEVSFRHRSFLDFFCGNHIYEYREKIGDVRKICIDLYMDSYWQDAVFFYYGLRRELDKEDLDGVFDAGGDDLNGTLNKYLIGRLMQAGWHSTASVKRHGVARAMQFAEIAHAKFLEGIQKANVPVPKIYGDLLLLTLADYSFASAFLRKEVIEQFRELATDGDPTKLFPMMILMWAVRSICTTSDKEELNQAFLSLLDNVKGLPAHEEGRYLLFLKRINQENAQVEKALRRKIGKLISKNPQLYLGFLPPKKKGFRPKAHLLKK